MTDDNLQERLQKQHADHRTKVAHLLLDGVFGPLPLDSAGGQFCTRNTAYAEKFLDELYEYFRYRQLFEDRDD